MHENEHMEFACEPQASFLVWKMKHLIREKKIQWLALTSVKIEGNSISDELRRSTTLKVIWFSPCNDEPELKEINSPSFYHNDTLKKNLKGGRRKCRGEKKMKATVLEANNVD